VHVETAGWDAAFALWAGRDVRDADVLVCAGEVEGRLRLAGLFHLVDWWVKFVGLVWFG